MALTKIQAGSFEAGAIQTEDLSANTTAAFAVSLAPKVTTVNVANSSYTVLDDTAVNVGGGYIVVTGSDFQSGAVVLVDTTQATSTTYVNSTTLRAQIPAKSAATYNIYVVNPDGGVGIKLNGVNYSATPTWVTTSPLANVLSDTAFTGTFEATGATSYSVASGSSLPDGMTLVGANGYYYGTITVANDTTYSFTINATDAENQDSSATFNLTAIAAVLDQYFNSTVLLLQGDGTNGAQNKTILDSSTNATAISRYGNVTQGSLSPFSPTGWSNYFDGTGDYLTIADNAALDVDGGNFTMEAWVYMNVNNGSAVNTIFAKGFGSAGGWMLWIQGAIRFRMYDTGGTQFNLVGSTTPAAGQWHHIAATRSGNTLTIYLNGVSEGTLSYTSTNTNAATFEIGGYNAGTAVYAGYISNARLVKGSVVYASNFTPATESLTAVSGTSLLTCQNNRFVDNSTNNFSITKVGDTKVVPFSPFAPTEAYNPTTHGGSIYLDDSGDFMTVESGTPINFGTNNFTIEWWVQRVTAYSTDRDELPMGGDSTSSFMLGMQNGQLQFGITNTSWNIESSITIPLGVWAHCAIVRSGTTVTMYINGVSAGSATMSTNFTGASYFQIGRRGASTVTNKSNNYLSGLRIVNGTAVYTSAFTPPTSAPTAITNTSLLVNGTNAGIYDATAKNVLETVGNAQVSTSVKKYGTGSIYIPAYTDTCKLPGVSLLGDFTIEGWFKPSISGDEKFFILQGINATNGFILATSTTEIRWRSNGSTDISYTISDSNWYHVAIVRSGTSSNNLKMYYNGNQVTQGTYTNQILSSVGSLYVGIGNQLGSQFSSYGYIDDLRITNGVARYTSNFTPPTAALPVQ